MPIFKTFAICLLCVYSAYSQTERNLWDSLQARMAAGIKGNFKETRYVDKISKVFFSEGSFSISEKGGIAWEVQKPIKLTMNMSMDSLKTFFAGDYKSLKNDFDVELSQSRGGEYVLMLRPKEKTKKRYVQSVELRIAENVLRGCIITWGNKDKTLYEFSVP